MLGSVRAWFRPDIGTRWPSITIRVWLEALAPKPWMTGAYTPAPSALVKAPCPADCMPEMAGTFCRICCGV